MQSGILERVLAEVQAVRAKVDEVAQRPFVRAANDPQVVFVKTDPVLIRKDPAVICAPDQGMGDSVRSILRLISPMDVIGGTFVRKGCPNDGA